MGMTADELRQLFERQLAEEHGQDWVDELQTMPSAQWEYVLFMGFIPEDEAASG